MDIKIPHSWLTDHLETRMKPEGIAKLLSLCGPSVEKLAKKGKDVVYHIEITTNRIDLVGVRGIAREAAAILTWHGAKANLKPLKLADPSFKGKSLPFKMDVDHNLVKRATGVVISGIANRTTPEYMKFRLREAGVRSLGALIDITNYVMLETGYPCHIFDYDKIPEGRMSVRLSRKGEKVIGLDSKEYRLPGGDIVFTDINDNIIDVPGIIGTHNSAVDDKTERALFFIDNNDPQRIRNTSMSLGLRTVAAAINEKGPDAQMAHEALLRGLYLYQEICGATQSSKVYDYYKYPYKGKNLSVDIGTITDILSVSVSKRDVKQILSSLGFDVKWVGTKAQVSVPSFRANDINIPEDIVEEVARIYGYHKLPSIIMEGPIPKEAASPIFEYEKRIRHLLSGWGGVEIYTSPLVPEGWVDQPALRIRNPLGIDSEYLRTSLAPSLADAARKNKGEEAPYHLFEIANVYLPLKGNLPIEQQTLAGIFALYEYREAKGIVEALLEKLKIKYRESIADANGFKEGRRIAFVHENMQIGELGELLEGNYFYSFAVNALMNASGPMGIVKPPEYPAQIEDLTVAMDRGVPVAKVLDAIRTVSKRIENVELTDIYKHNHTFRIWYRHPSKTLTNKEVEKIRSKVIQSVGKRTGGTLVN